VSQRQAIDAVHDDGLTAIVEGLGFTVERRRVVERVHYSTDDWVVFTYSNVLVLEPQARAELRSRLEKRIGAAGVDARKDGVAVICTPPAQPRGRLRGEAPEASA
ncbi:MAG: hypothetical protein QOH54_4770, partial [Mycobacterium sp.]|nr:hypothetical protein [Mycobacterium sp.]